MSYSILIFSCYLGFLIIFWRKLFGSSLNYYPNYFNLSNSFSFNSLNYFNLSISFYSLSFSSLNLYYFKISISFSSFFLDWNNSISFYSLPSSLHLYYWNSLSIFMLHSWILIYSKNESYIINYKSSLISISKYIENSSSFVMSNLHSS